jgi:arginine decarboxylase-like protein
MELLDSDDPIKGLLLQKSALHREQLEEDVKLITERTEKIVINALIVGGALAVTYYLVSKFSSSKSQSKKSKAKKVKWVNQETDDAEVVVHSEPDAPGIVAQIGTALVSQATVILLNLAKEKLEEFLQAQSAKNKDLNDNP